MINLHMTGTVMDFDITKETLEVVYPPPLSLQAQKPLASIGSPFQLKVNVQELKVNVHARKSQLSCWATYEAVLSCASLCKDHR